MKLRFLIKIAGVWLGGLIALAAYGQGVNLAVGPTPITTPGVYDLTLTVIYHK